MFVFFEYILLHVLGWIVVVGIELLCLIFTSFVATLDKVNLSCVANIHCPVFDPEDFQCGSTLFALCFI